jgi:hypothetical protein
MADVSWNELKLVIDGKEMPAPTDFEVEMNDYDGDSVRNVADGVLSRIPIRLGVKKFSLKYSMLDMETVSTVLKMLHAPKVAVQYLNPETLKRETGYMYCNKKTFGLVCVGTNTWTKALSLAIVEY